MKLSDGYLARQLGGVLGYDAGLAEWPERLILVRAEGENAALAILDLDKDGMLRRARLTRWGTRIASEKITMREVTEFLARPEPS